MRTLYIRIKKWCDKTFGRDRDPYAIIIKMQEELNELNMSVQQYAQWDTPANRSAVQKEMADIMILMINLATSYGMCYDSFVDMIQIKYSINLKREWDKHENGTFKHKGEDE